MPEEDGVAIVKSYVTACHLQSVLLGVASIVPLFSAHPLLGAQPLFSAHPLLGAQLMVYRTRSRSI